ncbi:MAG: YlxR family protein [Propionibacteriales bacterium]|nr:YlxR family protein [Propionibacteriales bacterium]
MVIRTCIGCRERADKTDLVRFTGIWQDTAWVITPDTDVPHRGRGAHLHPTTQCLELARRRNAVRRALKIEGEVDVTLLAAMADDRQDLND